MVCSHVNFTWSSISSPVNLVTTIAKLVPVFVFIVIGIFAFHIDTFLDGFWGKLVLFMGSSWQPS